VIKTINNLNIGGEKTMGKYLNYWLFLFFAFSMIQTNVQAKNKYIVDLVKSKVSWVGSKPGGQHHGTVNISDGIISLDRGEIESGVFTIDLTTIADLDLEPGSWNDKLVTHLKSNDFFYVEKYPKATFEITKSKKVDKENYFITGNLTIRGITNSISFDAKVSIKKNVLNATSSEIVLDRVKWDIKAMSKSVFADLKDKYVDDEMLIKIELTAISR
jgi:polyisoprenoid-binding protein YceI